MTGSPAPDVAWAACPAAPTANEIVRENCEPGTPASTWDVGSGSSNIQGYTTDISVDRGQTVTFKVATDASDYRLDIYRMGYYGGDGARRVATIQPSASLPQAQPGCSQNGTTGLVDCANWRESARWDVPPDAVSGIYFAHLVREDGTNGENHVFFVVRDDDGRSDLLFQTSDTTWQAYNAYGGSSLYIGAPAGRAYKVSYNRPFTTRANAPEDWVFNAEYPMVRWLERNGYDVSYFTGVDSDRYGAEILEHRAFLSVAHDEYWSAGQRANVEAARAAGVSLGFFSGNEAFWKSRWEDDHRTLVSYKETHDDAKIDPLPGVWTGTWRDGRFGPHDGGRPENALTGQLFMVNDGATTAIRVPAADGMLRFWRDTDVGSLGATLPLGTLGYEWDVDVDNGHRPAGSFRVSSTTVANAPVLEDEGSSFGTATATHSMTLYRHASGALVFGAGTVQWPWGLDSNHDRGDNPADARMQQATANVLADMGVHAGSLQDDLTLPACSTDTEAPTSAITSTSGGTIRGTAADTGGGRVGGVEVSTDGGATWHPAEGRESWTYRPASGSSPLSRAVDDSGNLEGTTGSPGSCNGTPGGGTPGGGTPGGGTPGGGTPGGGSTGGGSTGGSTGTATSGGGSAFGTDSGARAAARARVTSRRVRVSPEGLLKLRVACSSGGEACKARLRLRRDGRTLAARRVVLSAGDPRVVRLYLSRSVRRVLALARELQVTAVASVPDGAGQRTVTRTPIRLLAPRGR